MSSYFFLIVCFSAALVIGSPSPRDLADEALEQVETLKSIVKGEIMAAHNDLTSLSIDFLTYSDNIEKSGQVNIESTHERVLGEITQIKDLAAAAGQDISSCTNLREQLLNYLPAEYSTQLNTCIKETNRIEIQILSDAFYIIDTYINKVDSLEFQVKQCQGQSVCINPILTQIELNMIRIPQIIEQNIVSATELLDTLKLSVQMCADTKVAEYSGDATHILQDIEDCVNRILG